MEQFNLDTWLQDKSRKVVTRDGRPVRILCTDAKAKDGCCIIAAIETDGEEEGYQFFKNGKAYSSKSSIEDCADLFFADDKFTEFEKELEKFRTHILATSGEKYDKNGECVIKNISKKLLDLAREGFIPKKQYDEDLEQAYKNADKVQFNRGMDEVLTNPQKYFHIGDTIRLKNSNAEYTITSIFNGRYYGEGWSIDIIKAADDYELVEDCNEISDKIDYSSEIIGFLKNYIKAHGCTAMNSWVKWLENKCNLLKQ